MREYLGAFGVFFSAIAGLGLAFAFGAVAWALVFDKPACEAIGKRAGVETFYSIGTSCLVKQGDAWVTYGVYFGQKQEVTIKQR